MGSYLFGYATILNTQYLQDTTHLWRTQKGDRPPGPHLGERVPALALRDQKKVSSPIYMLVWYVPTWARPLVNRVA